MLPVNCDLKITLFKGGGKRRTPPNTQEEEPSLSPRTCGSDKCLLWALGISQETGTPHARTAARPRHEPLEVSQGNTAPQDPPWSFTGDPVAQVFKAENWDLNDLQINSHSLRFNPFILLWERGVISFLPKQCHFLPESFSALMGPHHRSPKTVLEITRLLFL